MQAFLILLYVNCEETAVNALFVRDSVRDVLGEAVIVVNFMEAWKTMDNITERWSSENCSISFLADFV